LYPGEEVLMQREDGGLLAAMLADAAGGEAPHEEEAEGAVRPAAPRGERGEEAWARAGAVLAAAAREAAEDLLGPPEELLGERAPRRPSEPVVERGPRRWGADPDAHVHGLRVGGQFELRHGGPELDGVWEVVRVSSPHPGAEGTEEPTLVAARPGGGPPFVKLTAAAVELEEVEGNLTILRADPRG
jgi:hypothetical protein